MQQKLFPDYVEDFIQLMDDFLANFDASLKFESESSGTQVSRSYDVELDSGKVWIVIHRTANSLNKKEGQYRVRMSVEFSEQQSEVLRPLSDGINRYSVLGVFIPSNANCMIGSQSLIFPQHIETLAALMASSIVFSKTSLIESLNKTISNTKKPKVQNISAWSDIDFERLRYVNAQYGVNQLHNRALTFSFLNATIELTAIENNPQWGGGLLCLAKVPIDCLSVNSNEINVGGINQVAWLTCNTPLFGGWCRVDDALFFTQFIPNFLKEVPGMSDMILSAAKDQISNIDQLIESELATN